jgi:hypothetical protein
VARFDVGQREMKAGKPQLVAKMEDAA